MNNAIISGKFFATKEIKKSRQEYTCCYCDERIEKGTSYIDHTVQTKNGLKHYKAHISCENCVENLNTYIKNSSYINYLSSCNKGENDLIFSKFSFIIHKFFQEFMCKDCIQYKSCPIDADLLHTDRSKCLYVGLKDKIFEIYKTFKYKELITLSNGEMKLIDRTPVIKCSCCGQTITGINTNFFAHDGSDFEAIVPFTEAKDIYTKIVLPTFWCGSDLTDSEKREIISCPHCGKFPFPDNEIQTYNVVEVVCFNKPVTENKDTDFEGDT